VPRRGSLIGTAGQALGKERDMTRHRLSVTAATLMGAMIFSPALGAENPAPSWDGLIPVASKRLDAVYLMPEADFRPYTKVMFDPVEVALKKNWLRDYNRTAGDLSGQISNADVQKGFETIRTGFTAIFEKAFSDAGYQVVTTPGPDVLRLRTGVMNLSVTAPDVRPGNSRTLSRDAGEATLILEARDSETGAVMGRAVDRRFAGDNVSSRMMRNSVTNRSDFSRLFADWAKASVDGLTELKALSPVDVSALPLK
jgi:hypothetical protein